MCPVLRRRAVQRHHKVVNHVPHLGIPELPVIRNTFLPKSHTRHVPVPGNWEKPFRFSDQQDPWTCIGEIYGQYPQGRMVRFGFQIRSIHHLLRRPSRDISAGEQNDIPLMCLSRSENMWPSCISCIWRSNPFLRCRSATLSLPVRRRESSHLTPRCVFHRF